MRTARTLVTTVTAIALVVVGSAAVLVFGPKADAVSMSGSQPVSIEQLHRVAKDLPVQHIEDLI